MRGIVTIDGSPIADLDPDEDEVYVGVTFPAEDGYGPPLLGTVSGWCNSLGLRIRDKTSWGDEQSVQLSISLGDPRGAFQMEVTASKQHGFRLSVPHPSDGMLHLPLTQLHDGFYKIGGTSYPTPEDDE